MAHRDPFFRDYWNAGAQRRLFDQHFGLGLNDDEILLPSWASASLRPFSSSRPRRLHTRQQSGVSDVQVDKERFQVMLDVQQFLPSELNVKTVDGFIVVEGKHDERQDEHGFISRQFVRRYAIPEDVKADKVECNLSSDGVLLISASRIVEEPQQNERSVPIRQTGIPVINKKAETAAPTTGTGSASTSTSNATTTNSTATASSGNPPAASSEGRRIEVTLTD